MSESDEKFPRVWVLLGILILGIGIDQGTKWWATQSLHPHTVHSYFGDTFRLTYALNPGAFLGLGGNLSATARFWLLTGLNSVFLVALIVVLIVNWKMRPISFVSLALLLSGGIGNLIDRTTQNGLVTDFLNVGIGSLRTGIFNVADMAIMAGAGILLWQSFRDEKARQTNDSSAAVAQ
ncbi:signal peptidase II [Thalassoroseus pseudoceratinae]|uniref:signal peptidase II n=1 Tax=Thalassoroseus pseudoceratinae TaxID=2713176 RepID=UPI00141E7D9C|nr:signal peptidase II [Thalassoroseus pseudoceratinae]